MQPWKWEITRGAADYALELTLEGRGACSGKPLVSNQRRVTPADLAKFTEFYGCWVILLQEGPKENKQTQEAVGANV